MSEWQAALGVAVGVVAGILSGLFGVGGAVITTPAVNVLLGGTAIQAVATPLPVTFPTSLIGSYTYAKAGEVSFRALRWAAVPGMVGAVGGAELVGYVNAHLLLVVTSALIGWTSWQVARTRAPRTPWVKGGTPGWKYATIGLVAGFVSGLLGIGGGIVMVPAFTIWVGMPLKRALGTSLVTISALVVPGTIDHWAHGRIDWAICLVLALGVVPGARIGAKFAIATKERILRIAVAVFLFAIAVLYGVQELASLLKGRG